MPFCNDVGCRLVPFGCALMGFKKIFATKFALDWKRTLVDDPEILM